MKSDENRQLLEALSLFEQHAGGQTSNHVMHRVRELQLALVEDEVSREPHSARASSIGSPAYS